jgi:hypothetical protein
MKPGAQHRIFGHGKSVTNEGAYPYFVEIIPVSAAGLDVALNCQIIEFHKSRRIQSRHERIISRYGDNYYRWRFADFMTALAFVKQFGGDLWESNSATERMIRHVLR